MKHLFKFQNEFFSAVNRKKILLHSALFIQIVFYATKYVYNINKWMCVFIFIESYKGFYIIHIVRGVCSVQSVQFNQRRQITISKCKRSNRLNSERMK